jgi:hypothetical protein
MCKETERREKGGREGRGQGGERKALSLFRK